MLRDHEKAVDLKICFTENLLPLTHVLNVMKIKIIVLVVDQKLHIIFSSSGMKIREIPPTMGARYREKYVDKATDPSGCSGAGTFEKLQIIFSSCVLASNGSSPSGPC